MGTNYYWYKNGRCEHCGSFLDEGIHIGKSSSGWYFALHIYPEDHINTLVDWMGKFFKEKSVIVDEYGREITADEMIDNITNRSSSRSNFDNRWLRENHAHVGLNGLAAHNIDGRHCIGNGPGTYDYMIGDFS